jgi:hypothetical protein
MSLIRFQSRETADVLMLAQHAKPFLDAWGKDVQGPGVLLPADMDKARQATHAVVQAEEAMQAQRIEEAMQAQRIEEAKAQGMPTPSFEPIGLRQRSVPLLEMMRRCEAAEVEIVWGV